MIIALEASWCMYLLQGEHGTPLHEAAMFGKGETVKLLLDKGASIEAKDRASKSVIDLLSEFPAERAREIRKMIEGKTPVIITTAATTTKRIRTAYAYTKV